MKCPILAPIAMLALAAALTGCGNSATGPTAGSPTTDTAAPGAPVGLSSTYDNVAGAEMLQWSASPEADVTGYEIYIYSPDPARTNSYALFGTVSSDRTSYPLLPSPGGNEFYRVRAIDGSGNRSGESLALGVLRRVSTIPTANPLAPGGGRDSE